MKLTGAQVERLCEISDGAEITISQHKGEAEITVRRTEDDLCVSIGPNGSEVVLRPAEDDREET